MSYPADRGSNLMEPNSLGLGMFASVGFHAVLFVGLALLPRTSETTQKPLQIVNILPPPETPAEIAPQAKTTTLEDILNNPFPDINAGFPPLGNTAGGSFGNESNNSTFLESNRNFGNRLNTDRLRIGNPPNRSFNPAPRNTPQPNPRLPASTPDSQESTIIPAPQASPPQANLPSVPPTVLGGAEAPSSLPSPGIVEIFPNQQPLVARRDFETPTEVAPEPQIQVQGIITRNIPFSYPQAACEEKVSGRVSVLYTRRADGTLFEGSSLFDVSSTSEALNNAALDLVRSFPERGTGRIQRYLSPFEFSYSDEACAVAASESQNGATPSPVPVPVENATPTPVPSTPPESSESSPADVPVSPTENPNLPENQPEENQSSDSPPPDNSPTDNQPVTAPAIPERSPQPEVEPSETQPPPTTAVPPTPVPSTAPAPSPEPSVAPIPAPPIVPPPAPSPAPVPPSPIPAPINPGDEPLPEPSGSAKDLLPLDTP